MGFMLLESGGPILLESVLGSIALDINPFPPIVITTTSPLNFGALGHPYTQTMAASGGSGAGRVWSITAGTLPTGISFSSAGIFSGTPTQAPYTVTLTLKVTDSSLLTASGNFSLTITGAPLSITTTSVPQGNVASPYSYTMTSAGGSGIGVNWSVSAGTLPAGLSLSAAGVLSGTPTTTTAGTSVTIQVNDSLGVPASKAFTFVINAALANLVVYSNGTWDETDFPSGAPYDLSFSCAETPGYTTNPKPGHTKSLQLVFAAPFGGGLQRASKWDQVPAVGVDISAYTQVQMSILTPTSTSLYASDHYSRASGNDIGTATAATQLSTCWNGITLNSWSTLTIPFSSLGRLSSYNYYKGNQPGSNAALTCQVDDIIFLKGNTGWIFRGRPIGLESGWTDASTAGANYAFLPNPTLNANCYSINNAPDPAAQFTGSVSAGGVLTITTLLSGAIRIGDTLFYNAGTKGTIGIGSGLVWPVTGSPGAQPLTNMATSTAPGIIPVVKMTPTATNQVWKATHAGFSITPYTNFTFGLIKPSGGTFTVQCYAPGGAAIGSAIAMSSTYTQFDFGTSTSNWTVYNVPWTAFGAIGTSIGGISIQSSLNALWYHCAVGAWS